MDDILNSAGRLFLAEKSAAGGHTRTYLGRAFLPPATRFLPLVGRAAAAVRIRFQGKITSRPDTFRSPPLQIRHPVYLLR